MDYKLIRSRRRTISLEINNGELLVRAPKWVGLAEIEKFINQKQQWINKALANDRAVRERANSLPPLTELEINCLADEALRVIPERVKYFAPLVGVDYGRVTIRCQRTKWGSCSQKGNLNFNCLLMLMPSEVLDSVVVHELCHRKFLDHSKAFYDEVCRVMPDYKQHQKWLRENSRIIMSRIR